MSENLMRHINHLTQYIAHLEEMAEFNAAVAGEKFNADEEREKFLTAEDVFLLFD